MYLTRMRWLAASGVILMFMAWAAGQWISQVIEQDNIKEAARRQPPLPEFPETTQTARNNNLIMQRGLVADLEGVAVIYAKEAHGLIDTDGHFRTRLSLAEAVRLMRRPLSQLCRKEAPDELDPAAELFQAHSATLTAEAKARSREVRKRLLRQGQKGDYVFAEWVIKKHAFSVNRLKNPTAEERIILDAIARAKLEVMPKVGDGVRAIPVQKDELEQGTIAFFAGMLPVAEPGK